LSALRTILAETRQRGLASEHGEITPGFASLPAAQVRALYPDREAFVQRHGSGPSSLSALRAILAETRQRGLATEDGEVTPGFASVASAVLDHNDLPLAGVAVTFPAETYVDTRRIADAVRSTANALTRRVRGHASNR
jgi:DNA-binding IclR family transcriptional regulator